MTISENVSPYIVFKFPLGSVCSAISSQVNIDCCVFNEKQKFKLLVDSSCTRHMHPYNSLFISCKETPCLHVIVADKSKVACLIVGPVCFSLQDKLII